MYFAIHFFILVRMPLGLLSRSRHEPTTRCTMSSHMKKVLSRILFVDPAKKKMKCSSAAGRLKSVRAHVRPVFGWLQWP